MRPVLNVAARIVFMLAAVCTAEPLTWIKRYGMPDRAEFAFGGIVETGNGNFVVCGGTWSNIPWDKDGYIIKIDAFGDTVWTRRVGTMGVGAGGDFIFDVILNNNNELVFTGTKYSPRYGRQVWFLKISLDGEILADKTIGDTLEDNGGSIIQNPDGTYLILGDTKNRGTQIGGKDIWLLKLDQNGDTIWTRTYDLQYADQGAGITATGDGGYLMTAFSCTGEWPFPPAYMGFASYLVIDTFGNLQKVMSFREDSLTTLGRPERTRAGGWILAGQRSQNDVFPNRDIWVMKLDARADTQWTRTIGTRGRYDGGASIIESRSSGYYLTAYSQTYAPPGMGYDNWWLLRLDDAGDTLWTRWYGGPLNDDPSAIILTSDSGLAIAGWRDANSWDSLTLGNADFWVIKADTNGLVSGIKDAPPVQGGLRGRFDVYPNPCRDVATVRFAVPSPQHVRLRVSDVLGRRMFTLIDRKLSQGSHAVRCDMSRFPGGVYYCELESDKGPSQVTKLLRL